MSTDRELLELAAKSIGAKIEPMEMKNVEFNGDDRFIGFMVDAQEWPRGWFNPLTDDGDALRLAVKLQLSLHVDANVTESINQDDHVSTESHLGDPYAATRRAIVRAAADIGKSMP